MTATIAVAVANGFGATKTFVGTGSGGTNKTDWNLDQNWSPSGTPASFDSVVIDDTMSGLAFQYLSRDFSVANAYLDSSSLSALGAFTIANSFPATLQLLGGSASLELGTAYAGRSFFLGGQLSLHGEVQLALGANSTIKVDPSTAHLFMDCKITGSGNLTKTGPGAIDLGYVVGSLSTAQNDFTGNFVLNEGSAVLHRSSASGTFDSGPVGLGTVIINSGSAVLPTTTRWVSQSRTVWSCNRMQTSGPGALAR